MVSCFFTSFFFPSPFVGETVELRFVLEMKGLLVRKRNICVSILPIAP